MKKSVPLAALLVVFPISFAMSADLSSKKEPVVTSVAAPTWTGGYVGLNAGGAFGNNLFVNAATWNTYLPASNADLALAVLLSGSGAGKSGNAGFIGGGQIGYNWQGGYGGYAFVSGIEADVQGIASSGNNASRWTAANTDNFGNPVTLLSNQSGSASLSYIGTVRGRVGWLATSSLLIYGTGGLAYGGVNARIQNTQFWTTTGGVQLGANSVMSGTGSYSSTQVGWAAGGGLEWMFMPNWSAKAEYLYYDLGRVSGNVVNNYYGTGAFAGSYGIQNITNYTARISGNIIRAGVNYHINFAPPPIIAKY